MNLSLLKSAPIRASFADLQVGDYFVTRQDTGSEAGIWRLFKIAKLTATLIVTEQGGRFSRKDGWKRNANMWWADIQAQLITPELIPQIERDVTERARISGALELGALLSGNKLPAAQEQALIDLWKSFGNASADKEA